MSKWNKELPTKWSWAHLNQVSDITMGTSPPGSSYNLEGRGMPLVNGPVEFDKGPLDRTVLRQNTTRPQKTCKEGDLLVCVRGSTTGRTNVAGFDAAIGRGVAAIRSLLFQPFLNHFLVSQREAIYALGTGSTFPNITSNKLFEYPIPVAPLNEQRRIVERLEEILSDLDVGVAALKRVQANLKRYRASVLKAAVEGKLTEAWRSGHAPQETGQQLLDRILKERRQRWEAEQLAAYEAKGKQPPKDWKDRYKEPEGPDTTDLPTLPEGWCWANVQQLLAEGTCNGISIKGTETPPGVRSLKLSAMSDSGFNYGCHRYIPIDDNTAKKLQVLKDDFFVSRGNGSIHLVGRGTLAQKPSFDVVFPDTMIRIRLVEFAPLQHFVAKIWSSNWIRNQIEERARTTAGIYKISQADVESFVIPLPPLAEQSQIVCDIDSVIEASGVVDRQVSVDLLRAARLRQSILKDAFEGRLVAQDPADEPASELLARIKTARQPVALKPASTIPPRRVPKEITHRRAAVVAYMISRIGQNGSTAKADSLGRTKLVKTLYIAQTHEELDLQFRFQRYAAGPFDESLFKLEGTAKKNDWFVTKERDNFGVTYHAASQTEPMRRQATKFLTDKQASFDRLLGHFDTMDMKQAELFATAYAAWNDLLIDGRDITEDSIIEEFYSWDESKKKFQRADILKQLKWMRTEGYIPSGKGERTQLRDKKTKLPSSKKRRKL